MTLLVPPGDRSPRNVEIPWMGHAYSDAAANVTGPVMGAMMDWNSRLATILVECNRQWAEFLQMRFQEDMEFLQRLARCRSPQDMWLAYSEFLVKAAKDYQDEAMTMSELVTAEAEAARAAARRFESGGRNRSNGGR